MRRGLIPLIVAGLAGVLAATPAKPAAAAQAAICTVFADLPAKVAIDRSDVWVPVRLSGCEGTLYHARAGVNGKSSGFGYINFPPRVAYFNVIATEFFPGSYHTDQGRGSTGTANDLKPLKWRYDTTTIKLATRASIASSRSGAVVTLTGGISRFIPPGLHQPYAHRVVGFQERVIGTSRWTTIGYAKTTATGKASITHRQPSGRCYRIRYGDTVSYWGGTSTQTCR